MFDIKNQYEQTKEKHTSSCAQKAAVVTGAGIICALGGYFLYNELSRENHNSNFKPTDKDEVKTFYKTYDGVKLQSSPAVDWWTKTFMTPTIIDKTAPKPISETGTQLSDNANPLTGVDFG